MPWVHQGRDPARGVDCIGLLTYAFAGTRYVHHPENRIDYGRDPVDGLLERRMRMIFGEPVAEAAPREAIDLSMCRPGDVVALRYAGPIRHVGMLGDYLHGGLSLIHTDSHVGKVAEHRVDDRWARRIALVYRPEVTP